MPKKGYKQTEEHKRKIKDSQKILFTKEQELSFCKQYKEGKSTLELAKIHGCNPSTIRKVIKRNGYDLRPQKESHNRFTKKEEKQVCKWYVKDKLSIMEIAKISGCSHMTICHVLKRYRVVLRTRKFIKKKEKQICKQYVEDKLSTLEIAKIHGCSTGTISNIVKRNDYEMRDEGFEKGKNHPMFGVHRFGKDAPMYGKHHSEKTKKKLREKTLLQLQNNPGPFKDTKPELAMENILVFLNIPYEKQFRIGNHLADFHFLNTNILAEVDGDYWHSNPKIFSKLNTMQLKQKEKDKKFEQIAKENGYILLRFWESDILKNKKKIIKRLNELKKI